MVLGGGVAGDAVLGRVVVHAAVDSAGHGHAAEARLRERAPHRRRPQQLARIGDDNARRRGVVGRRPLPLQRPHHRHQRALVDATRAADDTVGQHPQFLACLAEYEDHA